MPFRLAPRLVRRTVQGGFAFVCVLVGLQFHAFYRWAVGLAADYVPRPPAVEGFLPVSALLGLRRLLTTGLWDDVHPAGLTIFLAALVLAFACRKAFCGYVCPVGLLSNLLERAGARLGWRRLPPAWLDRGLRGLKYLLLALFLVGVFLLMDGESVESFRQGPYNLVSDAKMLLFFLHPSGLALAVLGGLALLSLVAPNAWCRYLCPYGALLGVLGTLGPLRVRRAPERCVDCRRCERECPSAIPVWRQEAVRSPECVGCLTCVEVCPAEGCLRLEAAGRRSGPGLPWLLPALGACGIMLGGWLAAEASGHWTGALPPQMLRRVYAMFLAG